MADKKATDYPQRSFLPKITDDLSQAGKGPSMSQKKNMPPGSEVDTKNFTHMQVIGPGNDTVPNMPAVKTPKTKM